MTIAVEPGGREALRRVLLQRLANDMAVGVSLIGARLPLWPCCWQEFSLTDLRGVQHDYIHRLCPKDQCEHWHHQTEVFYA